MLTLMTLPRPVEVGDVERFPFRSSAIGSEKNCLPPAASEMALVETTVCAEVTLSIRMIPPSPPKASRSTTRTSPSSAKVTSPGKLEVPARRHGGRGAGLRVDRLDRLIERVGDDDCRRSCMRWERRGRSLARTRQSRRLPRAYPGASHPEQPCLVFDGDGPPRFGWPAHPPADATVWVSPRRSRRRRNPSLARGRRSRPGRSRPFRACPPRRSRCTDLPM